MEHTTLNRGEQFLKKHKKWKRWQKIVSTMACVVVFCTTYALILPAITMEKNVYCNYEEHKEHTKACYSQEEKLVCKKGESEGHTHSNQCYEEVYELICNEEESSGHHHSDACYKDEITLICDKAESEGHRHGESCYDEDGNLICQKEETEGHAHDAACYRQEAVLVCDKKEHAGHTHSDHCYKKVKKLTCDKEESKKHKHGKNCYKVEETLTCTKPLHEHSKICYSNPKADLESRADWERSLQGIKLTGRWDEDVIAIAQSQLGYQESRNNYIVDENGSAKGYTRYGSWYGDPYGHWCAMFVSFCLNYAEVDQKLIPYGANCQRWIERLSDKDYQLYHPLRNKKNELYIPKVGDLIFFDWDSYSDPEKRSSDHIGLVAELITDHKGNVRTIKTIEGNSSDRVQYVKYDVDDDRILGYGALPENPDYEEDSSEAEATEKVSNTAEKDNKAENAVEAGDGAESAAEESDNTENAVEAGDGAEESDNAENAVEPGDEAESTAEESSDADGRIEKCFEADDYIVTASYTKEAGLPENVILTAEEIPANSDAYADYYQQALEALHAQSGESGEEETDAQIAFARFFDLTFTYDEQEIEPLAPVDVVISYKNSVSVPKAENAAVVHFAEDGIELLEVETTRSEDAPAAEDEGDSFVDTFTFTQDSFSVTGTLVTGNKIPMNQPIVLYIYANNKFYALAKDGSAVEIQTSSEDNSQVIVPEDRQDIFWEYTEYLTASNKLCFQNMEDEGYLTLTSSGIGSSTNESGVRYSYVAGSNGQYDSWQFYNSSTSILGTSYRYLSFDGSKFTTNSSQSQAAKIFIASGFVFEQPDPGDPVDPVDPEEQATVQANYDHYKTIDYLGDGVKNVNTDLLKEDLYRLNLDMTGIRKPVDLLLVVDASGSMKRTNNGGTTQGMTEIIKFLNGSTSDTNGYNPNIKDFTTNSCNGFIHEFFQINNQNRLAIVAFGGADSSDQNWVGNSSNPNYRYTNDAWLIKSWNNIGQTYNSVPVADGYYPDGRYRSSQIGLYIENNNTNSRYRWIQGTNYSAGLMRAQDEFDKLGTDNGERIRMMVFLSDGQPTYSIVPTSNSSYPTFHDIHYVRRGQGQQRYYDNKDISVETGTPGTNDCYYDSEQSFNIYQAAHPEVVNYSIAFKVSTAETQVLKYIGSTDKNRTNGKNFQSAENYRDLQNTILGVFQPRNVAIEDQLSQYVEFYEEQPDVKVTMTPKGGGTPVVLWEGYNPGHATTDNTYTYQYYDANNRLQSEQRQRVTSVTYKDGKIIAQFDEKFAMPQSHTFALSFNVRSTDYAYDTYARSGYDKEGDAGTDFATNTTSSLKPGFYSNEEATVSYTNGDDSQSSAPYDNPVVQVDRCVLQIRKTDPEGNPLSEAVFSLKKKDGTVVGNFIVDDDGLVQIPSKVLTTGDYILEEIQAPEGCRPARGNVSFRVERGMIQYDPPQEDSEWIWGDSDEKNTETGPDGEAYPKSNRYQYHLRIINEIAKTDILLQKTDSGQQPLAGAKFSLYKEMNSAKEAENSYEKTFLIEGKETTVQVIDIDQNLQSGEQTITIDGEQKTLPGIIYHGELREGRYYLQEDEAPPKFNKLTEPVLINITSEGVTYTYQGNQITGSIPGIESDDPSSAQIINTEGYLLPNTGGPGIHAYTIGGLLLMIMASLLYGFSLRRKKERRYH